MRHLIFTCSLALGIFGHSVTLWAELDERPLSINIVPAFPDLQWPAWLTGEEEGQARKILPIVVTGAGDGTNRLFVASQYGTIFFFRNSPETKQVTTFLDIRDRVAFDDKENEEGFLGLAFHPQFAKNGQLFVFYTPKDEPRRSVISRFRVSAEDANRADPNSEEILLTVPEPYWNHNGGTVAFGPDGYLYIALGDGGAGKDPHKNGQNLQTLLGTILRIDIDHHENDRLYAIPADNPFVGKDSARGEIWAYGLRNVWRHSFDRKTGDCWAADVGQDTWEEINLIRRGGNYGWNLREGRHAFGPEGSKPREDLIEPIWEYGREYGKSITGGHVYRGKKVPELVGAYLYADYVSGHLWALWCNTQTGEVTANRTLRTQGAPVMTFGEDDQGEVYFTSPQGDILKFSSQ
ncbi:MAG: PQQ-dependent sugar dehydrogenase [Planctomycetes bacterium]|nr:PQQ-dependent sugar dehydrogenase [Planctomycetota bacterium]